MPWILIASGHDALIGLVPLAAAIGLPVAREALRCTIGPLHLVDDALKSPEQLLTESIAEAFGFGLLMVLGMFAWIYAGIVAGALVLLALVVGIFIEVDIARSAWRLGSVGEGVLLLRGDRRIALAPDARVARAGARFWFVDRGGPCRCAPASSERGASRRFSVSTESNRWWCLRDEALA